MDFHWKKWSALPEWRSQLGPFAQDQAQPASDPEAKREIGQRKENQRDRIAQDADRSTHRWRNGKPEEERSGEALSNGRLFYSPVQPSADSSRQSRASGRPTTLK
jgi:hypothetical protein